MCTSYEWQHMVFTHGVQFNVFDNDHLTAGLFEHGAVPLFLRPVRIPG